MSQEDLITNILSENDDNLIDDSKINLNLEICDEYNHDEEHEICDWSFNDIELHNNEKEEKDDNDENYENYENDENEEEINLIDLVARKDIRNHDNLSQEDSDSSNEDDSYDSDELNNDYTDPRLLNKISSRELNSDIALFESLVKNQNETRIIILRRVLYSYLKKYIIKSLNVKPVLTKRFIDKVVEMGEVLDLENKIGAIMGDILLNTKNLNGLLITKYSNVIGAFLSTYTSQDNFLKQLLLIINCHQNLIDDQKIIDIFIACVTNRLVSRTMLKNWSQQLTEDNAEKLASELSIDILFIQMVDSILNN
jgi:hypothetical protein